jgi:hypothetical protein
VEYPSDWTTEDLGAGVFSFDHPDTEKMLSFQVSRNLTPGRDVIDDLTAVEADIDTDHDFERDRLESTTLEGFANGHSAAVLEGKWQANADWVDERGLDHDERFLMVWMVLNEEANAAYRIQWSGPASDLQAYRAIIEHTADTFAPAN